MASSCVYWRDGVEGKASADAAIPKSQHLLIYQLCKPKWVHIGACVTPTERERERERERWK